MRYHPLRFVAALVFFLSALTLQGCTSDSPTAPQAVEVAGAYTLQSVAGRQVPLVFYQDAELLVELLEGSVDFAADGTFVELLVFRETPTGAEEAKIVELQTVGTYNVVGNTINFQSADAGSWSATASGRTVTYLIFDVPFTFGS